MLQTTINSYLYQQYADDDDLQAFVAAYNSATQTYVDWFNSVGLPFYPGLSGDLLTWVVQGIYGMPKPVIESQGTPAVGTLNSEVLNVAALNTFTAPTSATYYTLSDDVFKRILSWNFYKGDGKRFCIRWLKRRVMRFLVGTDGLDPDPADPAFIVGPENTSAISVSISSGILTVTINQTLLLTLAPVTTQLLNLFSNIFQSGILDLPADFTYAVTLD